MYWVRFENSPSRITGWQGNPAHTHQLERKTRRQHPSGHCLLLAQYAAGLEQAKQDTETTTARVGHRYIRFAIAIEIPHDETGWLATAGLPPGGGLECAITIPQDDAHGVGAIVGDGKVKFAIAIEVGLHQRNGVRTRTQYALLYEGAIAVADEKRRTNVA